MGQTIACQASFVLWAGQVSASLKVKIVNSTIFESKWIIIYSYLSVFVYIDIPSSGSKPLTPFCLKLKDNKEVLRWMKKLKNPDDYAAGSKRAININTQKIIIDTTNRSSLLYFCTTSTRMITSTNIMSTLEYNSYFTSFNYFCLYFTHIKHIRSTCAPFYIYCYCLTGCSISIYMRCVKIKRNKK